MQRMVPHSVRNPIEKRRDLLVTLVLHVREHGLDQVHLVAPAGFDYEFAGGCALDF